MAKLQEMSKFPWEVLLNGRLIKKIILRNLEPEKIYTNLNFFLIENLLYNMFFLPQSEVSRSMSHCIKMKHI